MLRHGLLYGDDKENPSWSPVRNWVHPSELVFQKSWAIASDFCGLQTHDGDLRSVRVHDRFYFSTIFISWDNFTQISEITFKSSEITVRNWKSQPSVEEINCIALVYQAMHVKKANRYFCNEVCVVEQVFHQIIDSTCETFFKNTFGQDSYG